MLHHEGKVGTHALLTQLLYIIYKSERETKSTEMGTEAIGSSCRSSNHTRSKDHRGKTVIMVAGSLEGSSNLLTGTYSPRTRSFRRAHPSSQSLKKETEGEEKEKAEVSVTVTKTESKAKLKWSCKTSVQCQCPFSSWLLKIIMQKMMLLPLHPAMISSLPSTQLVLLCIVQYRQWHKLWGHRRL